MNNIELLLSSLGITIPSILLPQNVDLKKWSVIACDQFTQDRDYWKNIKKYTNDSPSALNLIFPEVFLTDENEEDAKKRISSIHSAMKKYLQENIFNEPKRGFVYVERDTPFQKKRRGLVAAIDLEKYDWKPGTRPLIRSTEDTVSERLPPRMNIRRGAPLELPHILLLINDEKDTLLPALGERIKRNLPLYVTELMMNSGSIRGWFTDADDDFNFIADELESLCKKSGEPPFLFAVGDGNHSLAAAKNIWEENKAENPDHPCRYALVEIENIYDPAIQFEPIHRLVFDTGFDETVSILSELPGFSCTLANNTEDLLCLRKNSHTANCFGIISEDRYALINTSFEGISTVCLQPILDKYSAEKEIVIDYIHDDNELLRLSSLTGKKAAGILLPSVKKDGLFKTIEKHGPLPRKSFSMGHSIEKRFYLECRQLF